MARILRGIGYLLFALFISYQNMGCFGLGDRGWRKISQPDRSYGDWADTGFTNEVNAAARHCARKTKGEEAFHKCMRENGYVWKGPK